MSDSDPECNWWTELDRDRRKPKFQFNEKIFALMIHEVFLTKKLPDHYDAMQARCHESRMLALMADIIQDLSTELPKSTHNLFQTWSFLQCRQHLEAPETQNAIASLQNGEMLALYIREQNCCLTLYVPHDHNYGNKAIASAFPVSLENSLVMSNENDLQMSFPAISVSIPFDNFVKSMPFAEQLSLLDQHQFDNAMPKAKKSGSEVTETRNVADPMYVSKWLLAFLTNEHSDVVTGLDFPKIVKKFRDDVIFEGGNLPYRRSGLWMAMKVALQLNLETEFESDKANCIYKIIQIHLASKMCEYMLSSKTIDAGLAMEMIAKVARRLDKLVTKFEKSVEKFDLESLYRLVISNSKDIIIKISDRVNEMIIKMNRLDRLSALLTPLDKMNFQLDSIHEIPSLRQYLESRVSSIKSSATKCLLKPKPIPRHRVNSLDFPNFDFVKLTTEVNFTILLADVENWIWENCSKCTAENVFSLRDLAVKYGMAAKKYYVEDPLGGSRMILTILQIIRTLDEIAAEEYSILEEHHTGINPKIIEDLLLPTRYMLKVASGLENYFTQRNSETSFPALNAESKVTKESFACRYAESNPEMVDLLQIILDAEEEKIEAKMLQLSKARMEIEQWKAEAKNLQHEFIRIWATCEYRTVHNRHCKLCRLQKKWAKHSVEIYERSISREESSRYAIVFELLIPTEISCLRDVLQFAAEEFLFTSTTEASIRGDWINYEQIACHKEEWDRRVHLGSSCILYVKSHYAKALHAYSDDDDFVVNNGYNCIYYGNGGPKSIELGNDIEKQTIKRFCTFNVEPNSPYRNLQWTLSNTNHSQNEVLANQSNCPIELNLSEYVAFGSLRSDGHRLEMRNIYRALATEALSFEKESVAALICQALWQAGPKSEDNWLRESYEDLADNIFASQMLELLSKYLSSQQDNWKHPLKVMVAILIVARIIELNDDASIVTTAVSILLFSRSICDDWMARIQKAKSACDFRELSQIQSLRTNMVDAGICCALTFAVNSKSKAYPQIWQSITTNSAIYYWLSAVVNVNNNIILSTMENSEFSGLRRTFLRQIWVTGVNAEKLLLQQVTRDFPTDVNRFVANQWPGVRNGTFKLWSSFPEVQQIVHTELENREEEVQINYIQIDIIAGTFLVNGMPISNLPDVIVNSGSFKRTFGSTCFEVQPNHSGTFCTRYKYNDCSYQFKIEMDQVIVTEVRSDGDIFELIPIVKFGKDIPFILQQRYSHWWNQKTEIIEFRPIQFNVLNFASSDQIQFELNLDTKLLIELRTSRCVIDRLSRSFVKIAKQLERLESEKYLIAFMDGPENVSIELPRMRIQFKVGASNEITSHEYVGMKICSDQKKFGTLFGLRSGLLLEHQSGEMLIIMPHGKIKKELASPSDRMNVWIATEDLRDPPFFIYDIDQRCQQLKARGSFSEWFYLAHLHAVTSQVLPDPFTGMKGTEKSLQILQSAYCWSSEPYDSEATKTLKRIRKLSATRSYHPPHQASMQKIKWPKNLPSSSSHEAFAIVARRLFRDSERLNFLYFKESLGDDDDATFLNERSYRRYICYDGNAAVTNHFTKGHNDSIEEDLPSDHDGYFTGSEYHSNTSSEYVDCSSRSISITQFCSGESGDDCHTVNIRILSILAKHGQYHVPKNCENRLRQLLFKDTKSLKGRSNKLTGTNLIRELNSTLPDLWIDLYNIACDQNFDTAKFTLALTVLALNGNNLYDLLTLQVVAANPLEFQTVKSPDVNHYTNLTEDDFKQSIISKIVSSCKVPKEIYLAQFEEHFRAANETQRALLVSAYSSQWLKKTDSQTEAIIQLIENQWPCDACDLSTIYAPEIHTVEVIARVDPLLKRWCENRQLNLFLAEVGKKMRQLSDRSVDLEKNFFKEIVYKLDPENSPPKYKINFMEKIHRNFNENVSADDIKSAERLFRKGIFSGEELNALWQRIKDLHLPTKESFLNAANIYPRLVPTLILPQMISSTNVNHKTMIGSLGVLISLDQRAARIKNMEMQPKMEVALRREKEEEIPFSNWSPSDYPQWLLFEIEMNLTIRRVQVEVAKNMIQPPTNTHSVMQLNMGEGKTSVIVPQVCAVLSNKKHVCQVTVLKPLFESNLKSLRKCLGGMLNHRVYAFPCRRDMKFSADNVNLLLDTYKECKTLNGIIMTLPEWRLSLQLKMYESSRKNEFEIASMLFKIHKWLNKNVRNILDESDAILNAKYQLIYTVGEQLPLDGGELRWLIIQNVLKIIPSNLKILWDKYGNEKIEFDHHFNTEQSPEKFCHCRILHSSVYDELQANIANDFVEERTQIPFPKLKTSEKVLVKAVLCDKYVAPSTYDECMKIFEEYPVHQNVIFLLSGLLKFEVLHLVLRKRWRVNYGVNPNGKRKMAVPHVAKDVCAENTEFGHPDVAICFTYLSYYYSGLTDEQLLNCFDTLSRLSNGDEKYKEWICCMPPRLIDKSFRTYKGVNLSDATQRTKLFTVLRYNMNVIDFWLANIVFPREAKIFDMKMMCTAWDLCSEELSNVVTGFSGTNDTKLLLPKPICQNDLKELENTNKMVHDRIIQEENDNYVNLKSNISGLEILKKLVEHRVPVLLDSGALMLELNNEQVAKQWLNLVSTDQFDAAVYVNERNILMVVDRHYCHREFDCSPYFERLDRCIVYLDDVHTRGTDLKFPTGIQACVTLSGGITRDKTVQACMRMRLLGQGHTICFWASEEADNAIREVTDKTKTETISVRDVFQWICHNSRVFEEDGLVHWSVASYNYSQKLAAYRYIDDEMNDACAGDDTQKLLKRLSNFCTDKEIIKLVDLYGGKKELSVVSIFTKRFSSLIARYSKLSRKLFNNNSALESFLSSNYEFVVERLQQCIPDMKRFSHILDEEQEKELEYELEEQRVIKRPGIAIPLKPAANELLGDFLRHGLRNRKQWSSLMNSKLVMHLPKALEKTSLWSFMSKNETKWGNDIYATSDFVNVVDTQTIQADEFLRPVQWIVSAQSSDETKKSILLLLSPFEVNQFVNIFRGNASTTLRMYAPRLKPDLSIDTMINTKELQMPFDPRTPDVNGFVESQLSVFAGTIYFENKIQLENYCTFLGIIPSPFSEKYQQAYDKGQISMNGFVRPEFRDICDRIKNGCPFKKNPDKLVCEIIERRHGFLPNNSHVAKIVIEGTVKGIKYGN